MQDQDDMQHDEMVMPTYPVDLRRISTPREKCLMLTAGPIDSDDIIRAEAARFDQLPVLDPAGILRGLVAVDYARILLDAGQSLNESDPALELCELEERTPLISLLTKLSGHRAIVFRDKQRHSEGGYSDDWFALVTISDLNRHPFRAHLYPILVELEALLAELIDRYFDDPWTWLPRTGERQAQLIGRWELERRNSVDLSPITGCTLPDMINVVSRSGDLRKRLGFKSANEFAKHSGSIPKLRNQIMHPVSPFILNMASVTWLRSTLVAITDLTQRVKTLNASLVAPGTDSQRLLP